MATLVRADVVYMLLLTGVILTQKGGINGVSTAFELETTLTNYVNGAHEGAFNDKGEEVPSFEDISTMPDFGNWFRFGFMRGIAPDADGRVMINTYNEV